MLRHQAAVCLEWAGGFSPCSLQHATCHGLCWMIWECSRYKCPAIDSCAGVPNAAHLIVICSMLPVACMQRLPVGSAAACVSCASVPA